jgi:hypothetical protein
MKRKTQSKKAAKKYKSKPWDVVVDQVMKAVFRVNAGENTGTCFLVSLGTNHEKTEAFAMFATAWHVLESLQGSSAEIEIISADNSKMFSSETHRMGFFRIGTTFDAALIMVEVGSELSQGNLLPITPLEDQLARGAEIGWLGFPGLFEAEPCFFIGVISGYLNNPPTYLVDGVAVNGVSGGPAFDDRAHLIGLVSSYIPNKVDEATTLPGLLALVPINAIRFWIEHHLGARVL